MTAVQQLDCKQPSLPCRDEPFNSCEGRPLLVGMATTDDQDSQCDCPSGFNLIFDR